MSKTKLLILCGNVVKVLILLYAIINLPFCYSEAEENHNLDPVILVPGLMGSKLYGILDDRENRISRHCPDRTNYHKIWVRVQEFVPFHCFRYWFKLYFNNLTNKLENPPGAYISAEFGSVDSVRNLGIDHLRRYKYYADIIKMLESIGYTNDENIKAAPYDFRRLPMRDDLLYYYNRLNILIDDLYRKYNRKVNIISHSMGGPIILRYLHIHSADWKNKHIKRWISINGAFAGSVKSIIGGVFGKSQFTKAILPREFVREIFSTFPSTYYLSPSAAYFDPDKVIVKDGEKEYKIRDLNDFYKQYVGDIYTKISSMNIPDPWINGGIGVPFTCVYSTKIPTIGLIELDQKHEYHQRLQKTEDGDGTLTETELLSCTKLVKNNKNQENHVNRIENVRHNGILKDEQLLTFIKRLISSE